jgi:hypothetical protein
MPPRLKVGCSFEHTACKHTALRKFSGQIAGAGSSLPEISNVVFIDACTGNGKRNPFSLTSSPEIFAHHVYWLHQRGVKVRCYLIESDQCTFVELQESVASIAPNLGWPELLQHVVLIHGDYRSPDIVSRLIDVIDQSVVFLCIDPNSVHQIELSAELRAKLPALTTWFVTLGCNVAGTKRSLLGERQKCFERVQYLLGTVRPHQDVCLVRLERDASQWAYLVNSPVKWRDKTDNIIRSLSKIWPKGVSSYWHSDGMLLSAAKELFLTKAEIDTARQPRLF